MSDEQAHDDEQDDFPDEAFTPWDALAELIAKLRPEDAKELTSIVTGFLERKSLAQSRLKRMESIAQMRESKLRAGLACKFQFIRFVLLLASIGVVGWLIYIDKFSSAPALFFGGLVAYLFGREPK